MLISDLGLSSTPEALSSQGKTLDIQMQQGLPQEQIYSSLQER